MNRIRKVQEGFVFCAAIALFVFGVTVLWSALQPTRVLNGADPILPLPSRYLFYLAGGLVLAVSTFLLATNPRNTATKLLLMAWLAANYLAYAIGLRVMHGANLFSCLGNLNNSLPISPKILDLTLWIFFGGLLSGACLLLVFVWFVRRKPACLEPALLDAIQSG